MEKDVIDLVQIDLPGYLEAQEDPSCEEESFDLAGRRVE